MSKSYRSMSKFAVTDSIYKTVMVDSRGTCYGINQDGSITRIDPKRTPKWERRAR